MASKWSDEQKAQAIEIANKETVAVATEQTGIPEGTIHYWRSETLAPIHIRELEKKLKNEQQEIEEWKKHLQTLMDQAAKNTELISEADKIIKELSLQRLRGEVIDNKALKAAKEQKTSLIRENEDSEAMVANIQEKIEQAKQAEKEAAEKLDQGLLRGIVRDRIELNTKIEEKVYELIPLLDDLVKLGDEEYTTRKKMGLPPGRMREVQSHMENFLGWKLGNHLPVIRIHIAALRRTLNEQYKGFREYNQ